MSDMVSIVAYEPYEQMVITHVRKMMVSYMVGSMAFDVWEIMPDGKDKHHQFEYNERRKAYISVYADRGDEYGPAQTPAVPEVPQ